MAKNTEGKMEALGLNAVIRGRGVIARCPTPANGGVMDCTDNIKELVRRWNLHEQLVGALTSFVDRVNQSEEPRDLVWAKAVAALKLAKEGM